MSIDEQIEYQVEQGIRKVLTDEQQSYSNKYTNPDTVKKYLLSLGFVDNHDFDTNGWQYDYWFSMYHDDHGKVTISGCGYYGGLTISKEKDEED